MVGVLWALKTSWWLVPAAGKLIVFQPLPRKMTWNTVSNLVVWWSQQEKDREVRVLPG